MYMYHVHAMADGKNFEVKFVCSDRCRGSKVKRAS